MDVIYMENIVIPSAARGLRIFVVDPDTSSLMHTAAILEEHSYKVMTIELANIALSMIRERENQYDLVIAEVDMPKMDGFTFLNHILHARDIPIILMSHKANMEMAKRALDEGACYFWRKPLRVKDLINVWQHIFHNKVKAKLQKVNKRKLTCQEEESFIEQSKRNKENNCEVNMEEKRKEEVHINLEQKQRLIWTPQLHLKFLKAVNALGGETKAQPKALLKLMNVPNLTHRHVASHLQKHRLRAMPSTGNSSSKAPLNFESSSYYDIDNIKELFKDVKTCSSNMIKNNEGDHIVITKCSNEVFGIVGNEKIDDEDTSATESNSRSTSSCGIGVVNFQEGNYYSQGLERQVVELQFSRGHIDTENNLVEYFGNVPNLEMNNGIDDLSCSSPLEDISMGESEIMKILEEELAPNEQEMMNTSLPDLFQ